MKFCIANTHKLYWCSGKRKDYWTNCLNSLIFWSTSHVWQEWKQRASPKLSERGCNSAHFRLISSSVPVFVYFRMIYLASERCFPHKKNGYFRAPLLLKKWTLIKRKLPSVFSDKSPALGPQWSSLCRKCVNRETHQINLLNLKHLFAFNLNVWMARVHVNMTICIYKC